MEVVIGMCLIFWVKPVPCNMVGCTTNKTKIRLWTEYTYGLKNLQKR